jgi:hypothetical protein
MPQTIFLDIDGVLNNYRTYYGWDSELYSPRSEEIEAQYPTTLFSRECVANFNRIIETTAAHIVLSSSWRWQIYQGNMSLEGFEVMLRSHGLRGYLVGATPRIGFWNRGEEIKAYIQENPIINEYGYVILDDDTDVLSCYGLDRAVMTRPADGLTKEDSDRAIEILKRQKKNFTETLPF